MPVRVAHTIRVLTAIAQGLRVDPPKPMGLPKTAITKTGALRLRPDHWAEKGGMDGFYIVRVRMR